MIRVTTLLPCVILHVAFIGGTSGEFRHGILRELKELISGCTFQVVDDTTPVSEDTINRDFETTLTSNEVVSENSLSSSSISSPGVRNNVPCCVLMRKPIDKILIRYNKIPNNLSASFESYFREFESGHFSRPSVASTASTTGRRSHASGTTATVVQAATDTLATLSRYLHHQRWLWRTKTPLINTKDGLHDLSDVLSQLVNKRIQEGFHFAYNKMGMINLTLEIEMVLGLNQELGVGNIHPFPCVIQYIVFPAQTTVAVGKE